MDAETKAAPAQAPAAHDPLPVWLARYVRFLQWRPGRVLIICAWLAIVGAGLGGIRTVFASLKFEFDPIPGDVNDVAAKALRAAFPDLTKQSTTTVMLQSTDGSAIPMLPEARAVAERVAAAAAPHMVDGFLTPASGESYFTYNSLGLTPLAYATLSPSRALTLIQFTTEGSSASPRYEEFLADLRSSLSDAVSASGGQITGEVTGALAVSVDSSGALTAEIGQSEGPAITVAFILLACAMRSARLIGLTFIALVSAFAGAFLLTWPLTTVLSTPNFVTSMMISTLVSLSLDYSLFLLSHLKGSLAAGADMPTAVGAMLQSAGHTVAVSGGTLGACFLVLAIIPVSVVRAPGIATTFAVAMAVMANLTLTPALLLAFPAFFALAAGSAAPPLVAQLVGAAGRGGVVQGIDLEAAGGEAVVASASGGCCDRDGCWAAPRGKQRPPAGTAPMPPFSSEDSGSSSGGGESGSGGAAGAYAAAAAWWRDSQLVDHTQPDADGRPAVVRGAWATLASLTLRHRYILSLALFALLLGPFAYRLPDFQSGLSYSIRNVAPRGTPSVDAFFALQAAFSPGTTDNVRLLGVVAGGGEGGTAAPALTPAFFASAAAAVSAILAASTRDELRPEDVRGLAWDASAASGGGGAADADVVAAALAAVASCPTSSAATCRAACGANACMLARQAAETLPARRDGMLLPLSIRVDRSTAAGIDWVARARLALDAAAAAGRAGTVRDGEVVEWHLLVDPAVDSVRYIYDHFGTLAGVTAAAIFAILAVAFRSLVLPLRALATICAMEVAVFGAATALYGQGVLADAPGVRLTFSPDNGLFWLMPILAFSLTTGFGLDYDIFLMTSVAEERDAGWSDSDAAALGLLRSGPVISWAGAIMAVAYTGFLFSHIPLLNQLGFFIVFAVLLDAFVVRPLLVPAVMGVLGRANFWPRRVPLPHRGPLLLPLLPWEAGAAEEARAAAAPQLPSS